MKKKTKAMLGAIIGAIALWFIWSMFLSIYVPLPTQIEQYENYIMFIVGAIIGYYAVKKM